MKVIVRDTSLFYNDSFLLFDIVVVVVLLLLLLQCGTLEDRPA